MRGIFAFSHRRNPTANSSILIALPIVVEIIQEYLRLLRIESETKIIAIKLNVMP